MKVFLVGGAVRDKIMGVEPKDRDFVVVGATPDEMIEKGFHQVGADFPVFLDANGDEFALARTERKSGKGHTGFVTEFTPDVTLVEDLNRRDLTINAMAQDLDTGEIIDVFGGREDIQNGVLRAVSSAFRDDPLRVLRVARFAARFNFRVDADTEDMMSGMVSSGELDSLTKERVWKEWSRAMEEPNPYRFFEVLDDVDALFTVFPGRLVEMFKYNPIMFHGFEGNKTWMQLFWDITPNGINDLERMCVPNDVVKIAKFVEFFGELDLSNPVDVLDLVNVWKKSPLLEDVSDVLWSRTRFNIWANTNEKEWFDIRFANFVKLVHETVDIGFADLSKEDQETLKGPEIGNAINLLRLEHLDKFLESV